MRFYYQDYSSFILSILPIDIKEYVKFTMILIDNKILTISVVIFVSVLAILEKTDYKKNYQIYVEYYYILLTYLLIIFMMQ